MALTTDEQAMRSAFQELAATQPDAPRDRLGAVRRRYRRRRTTQSVAAALSVAVLVAGGVSVASTMWSTTTQPATTATAPPLYWQLTWPERTDGTVDKQRVLFWMGQQGFDDLRDVRWLYTATAPDTITKWAILQADYASSPPGQRAKALFTVVSHDGGDQWTARGHAAPLVSTDVIGVADQQGHAVLALAAPGVDKVELVTMQRKDGTDRSSFPPLVDGASEFTSSSALKPGSTLVRVPGADSTFIVLFDQDVQAQGAPDWWKAAPQRQQGDVPLGASFGGGGGGFGNIRSPRAATLVLQVRCVGPVPMRLEFTATRVSGVFDVSQCDGLFHTYVGPQVVAGDRISVSNKGSTDKYGDVGDNMEVTDVSLRP